MKEKHITRVSLEDVRNVKGKTDWSRVPENDADILADPEFDDTEWDLAGATVMPGVFAGVELPEPQTKTAISLRVDPDVLDFFKSAGRGYQTRMNAVLRAYMEAKKSGQA